MVWAAFKMPQIFYMLDAIKLERKMNDLTKTADSKGSSDPSEAGVRNHLQGIMFWILGATLLIVLAASVGIRLHTHGMQRHQNPVPQESTKPTTQPQ
jgi:hypothetical protein